MIKLCAALPLRKLRSAGFTSSNMPRSGILRKYDRRGPQGRPGEAGRRAYLCNMPAETAYYGRNQERTPCPVAYVP